MTATLTDRKTRPLAPPRSIGDFPRDLEEDIDWEAIELTQKIHEKARQAGLDKMTMEEIDAEIAASRRERRERKLACAI
ncbi:MAG: hypothetical protein LBP75_10555 [Planctomycetota bacterium]|nr:hypothetical protein [Planctomycetota bacterium]